MAKPTDITVILPSLNPDEKLTAVIDGLLEYGFTDIVLINDGSDQDHLHYFEAAAQHPEVTLLTHPVNRGKGAALKTGFHWFLENRPCGAGVVTVDGDNQHHSADTLACCEKMLETEHLVLGVRDFNQPDVPFRSRKGNHITSAVFKIFVGMTISDTQTGLRAIPRAYLDVLAGIRGDRFEYETNMLLALKEHHLPFEEVKIRTVYLEENKSSHFHPVRDSWRIYKLILGHFFRYALSSLISSLVDEGMFSLLSFLLRFTLSEFWLTIIPAAVARIVSSLLNFTINKLVVFHKKGDTGHALLRYAALAVPQALAQMLLTYGCYALLHIGAEETGIRALIYAIVMVVLFVFSFLVQQYWVFADKSDTKR